MKEKKSIFEKDSLDKTNNDFRNKQMFLIYETIKSYAENKLSITERNFVIPSEIIKKFNNDDNSSTNGNESLSEKSEQDEEQDEESDMESKYTFSENENENENDIVNKTMQKAIEKLKKYRQLKECLRIKKKYVAL